MVADHFWSQIFRCAAQSVGDASAVGIWTHFAIFASVAPWWSGWQVFGKSEVDEFEMAVGVKKDVFRFEISVSYVDDIVQVAED